MVDYLELKMRDIRANHLGKRIAIKGKVTKTNMQYPFYKEAAFQCQFCGNIIRISQTLCSEINRPIVCVEETCGRKGKFEISDESSEIIDVQEIEVDEHKDEKTEYSQRNMKVFLIEEAVEKAPENSEMLFIGILKRNEVNKQKIEYILEADAVEKIPISPNSTSNPSNSTTVRSNIKILKGIIKEISEKHPGLKAPLEEIYAAAQEIGMDRTHTEEYIKKMKQRGDVLSPDRDHIRFIN
jgi:DNA replicative helicase MCM subunit Mcm2 (Cdc46/Mcm family)